MSKMSFTKKIALTAWFPLERCLLRARGHRLSRDETPDECETRHRRGGGAVRRPRIAPFTPNPTPNKKIAGSIPRASYIRRSAKRLVLASSDGFLLRVRPSVSVLFLL